ncbi:hypothetical protein AGRA3207_000841 [Actinomadura graeca]|uniref:Uncharacterized protein n=1 Tax=Actinomadura graeca TaxID=2750812 RepID=A0ABX8QNB8_9ACTN|nr:hypothetical protein [Actinomadura graeca]QXJ20177.1 hypothetical protein AGRA3207_000841 [Actinomadura graeca]
MTNWSLTRPDDRDYLDDFGDLETAIDMVRGLNDELDVNPDDPGFRAHLEARFQTQQDILDVRRGCTTLVTFLAAMLSEPPLDFVPAAIRKIRSFSGVSDDVLPAVASGLTAAFLQQPVAEWQESSGTHPRNETLAWLFAAWSLVNFVDYCNGEKGYALRSLENMILQVLDQSEADGTD